MKSGIPIQCGLAMAVLMLAGTSWLADAQTPLAKPSAAVSTLPAAPPTVSADKSNAAPAPETPPQHADVEYKDGKLAVQATNASLNDILREVANKTGLKITGGVADDRVFGDYGPSTPSVVLDALLEGTGSNMLLVDDAQGKSELVLTPRRGGATPPNPNAEKGNEPDDTGGGAYVAPVRPYQPPVINGRGPGSAGPDPSVIPPSGDQGDTSAPKTPQQIYEQLQRSMQQRQANAPPQ